VHCGAGHSCGAKLAVDVCLQTEREVYSLQVKLRHEHGSLYFLGAGIFAFQLGIFLRQLVHNLVGFLFKIIGNYHVAVIVTADYCRQLICLFNGLLAHLCQLLHRKARSPCTVVILGGKFSGMVKHEAVYGLKEEHGDYHPYVKYPKTLDKPAFFSDNRRYENKRSSHAHNYP